MYKFRSEFANNNLFNISTLLYFLYTLNVFLSSSLNEFWCSSLVKGVFLLNSPDDPFAGKPHHWQQNVSAPSDYQELPKPSLPPSNGPTAPLPTVPVSAFNEPLSTGGSLDSDKPFPRQSPGMPVGNFKSTFTYEELKIATDNFSEANLLGQGGFGYVHKGVLTNGKVVAIKQLKAGSGQGEREFQAEIEIISQVHHRHLVSLVGYCTFGSQRLLVYEFVPNKTLEFHLHG